jgi:ABC transport system ATP-binding/permease protein
VIKEAKSAENKKDRPLKFTYKEQKEFEAIDGLIASLENEINEVNIEISSISSDYERLHKLVKNKEQLDLKLEEAFDRWTYLNELAEEIVKNK